MQCGVRNASKQGRMRSISFQSRIDFTYCQIMTFLSRLFARVDVVVMVDDGKASKQNLNSAKFTFQRRKLLNYDK